MNSILTLAAERLSGWDFLIAGIIVSITEWLIKPLMKKVPEKTYDMMIRIIPVILGAFVYILLFFVQKTGTWYISLLHGLVVGLTAMGSFDVILQALKTSGFKALEDVNKDIEKAIKEEK